MQYIAEHDPKQEREGDNSKQSWIELLIPGNAIGVNNLLKHVGELIQLVTSRGRFMLRGLLRLQLATCHIWVID